MDGTKRRATNPLNDVSIRAAAYCYADAGRNRQFVSNMRDATQSPQRRCPPGPAAPPISTSSVTRPPTVHHHDLHPSHGERRHRTSILQNIKRRSSLFSARGRNYRCVCNHVQQLPGTICRTYPLIFYKAEKCRI